ncbi:MAG: IS66 family transposase [Thaumarchaeota archaeon]|nr:IS66 family transposase [Nitrososphaerota archaeon]
MSLYHNNDIEYFRNRCNILEEEIKQVREENRKLREELALLKETVTALVARNIDARPDRHYNTSKRNHGRPGRKMGHEGSGRKKPDHIDAHVLVDRRECARCGIRLSRPTGSYERIVEDIVPAKVIVTKYKIVRRYCRNCRMQVAAPVHDALPGERFGLRLMVLVVSLKMLGLSYRKITDLFKMLFCLDMTESTVKHAVRKVACAFGPRYLEMIEELKLEANIHGDETSWRIDGKNHWLWAFVGRWTVIYEIDRSRGSAVPQRVLGDYGGNITSDSWPAWNHVGSTHQRCHYHYFREIDDTIRYKSPGRQFKRFAKKLRRILYDSQRAGAIRSRAKRIITRKRFEKRIEKLASSRYTERNCIRFVKRLRREKEMLFTFLEIDGVKCHNNDAERQIRPSVVIRKITYGNRSEEGAYAHKVLMSVHQTCNLRGQNFHDYALGYLAEFASKR